MARRLIPLMLIPLLLTLPPHAGGASEENVVREVLPLLESDEYFTRMAVGDVYPLHPGPEAVAVGRDQKVHVLYGSWPYFNDLVAYTDRWYLMTVATGDVLPEYPGDEIVVGGWSYTVTLIWWDGAYRSREIYFYKDWIYDVEVADVDPETPGLEVVVAGETGAVTLLKREEGLNFTSQVIYRNQYLIDGIYVGDFDPDREGVEVAAATGSFNVVEIYRDGGWKSEVIWEEGSQIVEVDGGELDPTHPGEELVAGGVKGRAVLLKKSGGEWNGEVLHTISGSMRTIYDVDVGDGDPTRPGAEVLISSWDGTAYMLYPPAGGGGEWRVEEAFHSDYLLIGGEMGDFDPTRPGGEALVCDSGGGLYAVYTSSPGVVIYCGEGYPLSPGGEVSFPLHIHFTSGYTGEVMLSGAFLQGDGEVELTPSTLSGSGQVTVRVRSSTGGVLEISTLALPSLETVATRRVNITSGGDWLEVSAEPAGVVAGYSEEVLIRVNGTGGGEAIIPVPLKGLTFTPSSIPLAPGTYIVNLTTSGNPPRGTYPYRLVVPQLNLTYYFTLTVRGPVSGDFQLYISPSNIILRPAQNATLDGAVLPLGEFSGRASLRVGDVPEGLTVRLSRDAVDVGEPFTITVEAAPEGYPALPVSVRVVAEVEGRERWREITVVVKPPPGDVVLTFPQEVRLGVGDVEKVTLNVRPTGGFRGSAEIRLLTPENISVDRADFTIPLLAGEVNLTFNLSSTSSPGRYALNITLQYSSEGTEEVKYYTMEVLVERETGGGGGLPLYATAAALILALSAAALLFIWKGRRGGMGKNSSSEFQ